MIDGGDRPSSSSLSVSVPSADAMLVEFPVEALGFYLREQYNRPVRILRYDQYLDTEKRVWYRVSFSLG